MSFEFPTCCIYGLIDPRSGAVRYIGQTARGLSRVLWHSKKHALKRTEHKSNWIKSLHVLGLNYNYCVLEVVPEERLGEQERSWIAYGRSQGWNLTNFTDGGPGTFGFRHREASKKSMSEKRRGVAHDSQWMAPARRARLGSSHSMETREKISAARRGISMKEKRHRVYVREVRTNSIFGSMREAARHFGVSVTCVRDILKGGRTYTGLTFREV